MDTGTLQCKSGYGKVNVTKLSNQMNSTEIKIGRGDFMQQLIDGVTIENITAGWEPELSAYREMWLKYLLYP